MAVKNSIEVTLGANTAAFTTKMKEAVDTVKGIGREFGDLGKRVESIEGRFDTLGANVTKTGRKFYDMRDGMEKFTSSFSKAGGVLEGFAKTSQDTAAALKKIASSTIQTTVDFTGLDAALKPLTDSLSVLTKNFDRLGSSQRSAAAASKVTTEGLSQQWLALKKLDAELANAHKLGNATQTLKSPAAIQLADQIANNEARIKNFNQYASRMVAGEKKLRADLMAVQGKAARVNWDIRDAEARPVSAGSNARILALQVESDALRAQEVALQRQLGFYERKQAAIAAETSALAVQNALHDKGVTGAEAAYRAEQRKLRVIEEQNSAMTTQNAMAESQMTMLKGTAELWAAGKIKKGLVGSVDAARDMQKQDMRLSGLNLSAGETAEFRQKSIDQAPAWMTAANSLEARLNAFAAFANNDVKAIDATLPAVLEAVQALKSQGYLHGTEADAIKNFYGIAETRGIMGSPEAVKSSIDTTYRLQAVSAGKLDTRDLETILRNSGIGATRINDDGLMGLGVLAEAYKTAGGGGGSTGGGTATVGTMIKMIEAYATGKTKTNKAVKNFMGAGLYEETFDSSKLEKMGSEESDALVKTLKNGSFKNSNEMLANPTKWLSEMRAGIVKYITDPKNQGKYFDKNMKVDNNDDIELAIIKFLQQTSMTQTAVTGIGRLTSKKFIERSDELQHSGKNMLSPKQLNAKAATDNFDRKVQEFDVAMKNLGRTVGEQLLPILTPLLSWINDFLIGINKFASENPLTAAITAIGSAIGGIGMTISGTTRVFGFLVETFTGAAGAAGVAAGGIGSVGLVAATSATTILAWAGKAASAFKAIGLVILAWDVGYYIGEIIAKLEVGGASIGTWAANLMDYVLTKIMNGWERVKSAMSFGINSAEHQANIAANNKNYENGKTANEVPGSAGNPTVTKPKSFADQQAAEYANVTEESKRKSDAAIARESEKLKRQHEAGRNNVKTAEQLKALAEKSYVERKAEQDKREATAAGMTKSAKGEGSRLDDSASQFAQNAEKLNRIAQSKLKLFTDPGASKADSFANQAKDDVVGAALEGKFDKDGRIGNLVVEARAKLNKAIAEKKDYDVAYEEFAATVLGKGKGQGGLQSTVDAKVARQQADEDLRRKQFLAQRLGRIFGTNNEAEDSTNYISDDQGNRVKLPAEVAAMQKQRAGREAHEGDTTKVKTYLGDKDAEQAGWDAMGMAGLAMNQRNAITKLNADTFGSQIDTEPSEYIRSGKAFDAETAAKSKPAIDAMRALEMWYDKSLKTAEETYQKIATAEGASAEDIERAEATKIERVTNLIALFNEDQKRGIESLANFEKSRLELRAKVVQTANEKLAEQWGKTVDSMQANSARWSQGFMDNLVIVTQGGRADWRGFLNGMVTDIQRSSLQKMFGGMITKASDGIGNFVAGAIGVGPANGKKSEGGGIGDLLSSTGTALKGLWNSLTGAKTAADDNTSATKQGTATTLESITKTVLETFGIGVKTTAESSATAALTALAVAANSAATSLGGTAASSSTSSSGGWLGSLVGVVAGMFGGGSAAGGADANSWGAGFGSGAGLGADISGFAKNGASFDGQIAAFANGGAFTNSMVDSPTLFKFANGGKFGLMGEAGPEAIMPLSRDKSGRLGVTVNGGASAGGDVVINIVVNNNGKDGSTESTTTSGNDQDTYKRLAVQIKSLVVEQMVSQQRPGGVLYRG